MIYKKAKKILSVILVIMLLFQVPFSVKFEAEAATITATVIQYSYVKPAPYWPCNPMDEFPSGTTVKILEREQDTFYIEYTKDGIVKRGYTPMSNFTASSYEGYSWCDQAVFTPGHNNTGSGADVYYGPGGSYAKVGAIDADEGIHAHKPLLVLRTSGSYSFIQYVTNPGTSGHVLFKRGWIQSSKITLDKPTGTSYLSSGCTAMIGNAGTGKFLQAVQDSSAPYGYRIEEATATGYQNQVWYFYRYTTSSGVYYKIKNMAANLVMEVTDFLPLVEQTIRLVPESSPNKAQEFAVIENNNGFNIATRCSGYYMVLRSIGSAVQQNRKVGGTNETWSIQRLNKYHNAMYSNVGYSEAEDMKTLNYYVEQNVIDGDWLAQVSTAVSRWNNCSYITGVKLNRCTNKASADICIRLGYDTDETLYGVTTVYSYWQPGTFTGNDADFSDETIRGSIVEINSYNVHIDSIFIHTLVHELGHALMLKHPFYELENNITLQDINMDRVAYSVMNQGGLHEQYPKIVDSPSYYDRRTLLNKWFQ
ncbi:MAG: RICIN domain-containing protein [Clostridia bacterium]|nr:RICIN domain-containing protein [Clostridia bacterium]